MNFQEFVPNLVGMLGVFFVLAAYLFLQLSLWGANDFLFSLFNFIGSAFVLFSLFFNWNFASATIEIIWLFISLYGILMKFSSQLFSKKRIKKVKNLSKKGLAQNRDSYFAPLSSEEIVAFSKELGKDWEVKGKKYIKRSWVFEHYRNSIDFLNQVMKKAESENHHPNFLLEHKKVTITIGMHNANALTQADYILASKISQVKI